MPQRLADMARDLTALSPELGRPDGRVRAACQCDVSRCGAGGRDAGYNETAGSTSTVTLAPLSRDGVPMTDELDKLPDLPMPRGRRRTSPTATARLSPGAGQGARVSADAGRVPDEGRGRPGDLRRQGQEPAGAGRQLLSQGRGRRPPHGRPGARDRRHRLHRGRERGRRPAGRSPADQGRAAQVQPGPEGRQDVSRTWRSPRARIFRASSSRASRTTRGTKLYGPFASAGSLRGAIQVLQKIFKFRTCTLDIDEQRREVALVPALPAGLDQSVHGAVQPADLEGGISPRHRTGCGCFWKARRSSCSTRCRTRWRPRPRQLQFEKAARLRDEIHMLETLDERGELDTHVQPEVFFVDPKKGLAGLQKVLKLAEPPRTIEGVDIAHLGGGETVASLVQFIDGLPFKPDYRRFKIRDVRGRRRFRQHSRGGRPAVPAAARRARDVSRHAADRRRQGAAFGGAGGVSASWRSRRRR